MDDPDSIRLSSLPQPTLRDSAKPEAGAPLLNGGTAALKAVPLSRSTSYWFPDPDDFGFLSVLAGTHDWPALTEAVT
jgi:hypothetical protein